ncbi:MAG: DHH family phosphoesterase [Bacilli bacterium]
MKYIQKTTKTIKENFLKELLIDRQLIPSDDFDYQEKYFKPKKDNLEDCLLLDNILAGAKCLEKHIQNKSRIYLVVDSDIDGFTSSAILYNYLMDNFGEVNIEYHIPDGKEHGLDTIMPLLENEQKYDLIILPDSSSNDYECHEKLSNMGYEILILDHHEAEKYSENAIVINNQLSKNYPNKSLSGVGVVYKFLQLLDERNGFDSADSFLDMVAVGECGDMMDLNTLENRFISDYGFSHLKNEGLRQLIKLQGYSIFGVKIEEITENFLNNAAITPINAAFYIAPLVNALIRVGSPKEKELLFQSFIKGKEVIPSTKRGHRGEFETIAEQSARNCYNARSRQNKEKEKALELLDIQISNDCLDDNKILILNADDIDVSNTLTGLCAMGVAAKYKKPVLLGRVNKDGYLKGSMRGRGESELKDFRSFLLESGYMDYVEGHNNAAGFALKESDIPKLYQYANKKLENINFNEGFYEADFIINGNCSYLNEMIFDLWKGKNIYGQNCPEPIIVTQNLTIRPDNIKIIGAYKDTIKITFNNTTFMKFKAKDLIEQLQNYSSGFIATIVGRPSVNSWNGVETPQILIEDIEINQIDNNTF